jgi:hypothetical protein
MRMIVIGIEQFELKMTVGRGSVRRAVCSECFEVLFVVVTLQHGWLRGIRGIG